MFERKEGETNEAWYQRLVGFRTELERSFRLAKADATSDILERKRKARLKAFEDEAKKAKKAQEG